MEKLISIVTPFYNESEAIESYFKALSSILEDRNHEIICVDDGSRDDSLKKLVEQSESDNRVVVVELSRNFGKEAALSAGLQQAAGDCVIILDADLQDPPELIPEMIDLWVKGADMVLAKRSDRKSDTKLKQFTANSFYKIYNYFAEVPIPENVGDFRLMDRSVLDAVNGMPERNRFMKGILSWPGFVTETVEYERPERLEGTTKWNYPKLFQLSLDGIIAFSNLPLKLAILLGLTASVSAISYAVYTFVKTLILGIDVPGYASLLVVTLTLGGLILICLGIIGEYLSRIYVEVKGRPLFLVRKVHSAKKDSPSDS
ncbi:MAG: glycosyltransferase family 2 protein [Verrucomicrobiota bacterium]